MADGSVEIKITGSIDPSVAASANEAKAAISGLGDSTAISAKAMAAALAATGGNLKAVTPEMLGLATAAKTAAVGQEAVTAATEASTVAAAVNTSTINSSRAAYESLALVHEALSGRFTRMAGTSTILAQALAGQAATTRAVAFATSAAGLSILGTVAAIGLVTAAAISFESEEKKLTATAVGLGAQSGITAEQLKQIGESADSASQSVRETTKAAEAFAGSGLRNEETVKQLSNSVEVYSQLIGVKFAEAQKTLAEAMKDPVKGAKELHEQLGILDGDQLQQIETLSALGEKDQAVAIITQALKERLDEARTAGVGLRGEFGQLIDVLSNVYNWIGQVTEGFGREAETLLEDLIPALHQAGQAHRDAAAAASQQAQNEAELNRISGKGKDAFDATPEGEAIKRKAELTGKLRDLSDALKVDTALHGANSEAVKHDREALDDYTHAVTTYLTPVQKKLAADALDVKLAEAKHSHNRQLVSDLIEQKRLLEESGKIESAADAKALAKGAGDVAGAKTFAPKGGKGPSIVSEWTEQLHAAEIASGEFFKDQTEAELAFWQSKVGLTKTGSKEWLEVQSKIYDAQKNLAHQNYDEHIADLNDRLEADRGDWKKEQADWQEKLAFIRSKFGEESTAYKDAHRQMEVEERQHQEQMVRAELSGNSREITALKEHLAAMRQLRETEARADESIIKAQADGAVLGESTAAIRIAQLHQQLAQQEISDAQAVFDKEEALRQHGLADMLKVMTAEDERYKNAKKDELAAEQKFQDQVAQLQAKATAQQIQDLLAIEAAYSSYISGPVSSAISGLDGILSHTKTWGQAIIGVYQSVAQAFEAQLGKMVTKWVVEHVFMTAAQRAQLALQSAQHAAAEAAKTATTTGGVAARSSVEGTGFFAKLLSLLGISVGTHTTAEATKTGATVAGAATRTAAETTAATTDLATQIATNVSLAASYSGLAGAAGVASWAAAPWPIDAGAPAFGAAMASSAAGFGALAGLATGTNELPRDMIVSAHEGERIIPKADNRKLFEVLNIASASGSAANTNTRPAANDSGRGDTHLHFHGPIIGSRAAMERWAKENSHLFGAGSRAYVRNLGNLSPNR